MGATSPANLSQYYLENQETGRRVTQNYLASLHSTRKQPAKPWKKPAIAPVNQTYPKIYRVEPINFKELVQRLTGAPELRSESPEPKKPPSHAVHVVATPIARRPLLEALETVAKPPKTTDEAAKENSFGFDLSPSSARFWEAFPLLSPSNLSRW